MTIKLASVAPAGSPWAKALNILASRWHEISAGSLTLKLYFGSAAGDEADLVRKIRIGQLQAAAVTEIGLGKITPDLLALSIPFLIRSEDEFSAVLEGTRHIFERDMSEKGFKVLIWSFSGWVNLFSKAPVVYPQDLASQRLAIPDSGTDVLHAWRSMGFDALSVPIPDLLMGLESGMVDALYSTPLVAAAFQWFGISNHMSSLKISPVFGAIIIGNTAWSKIPDGMKPALMEAVRYVERILYEESVQLEKEALVVMQKHGLVIHAITPDAERKWRSIMESGFVTAVEKTFSGEVLTEIKSRIEDYRKEERLLN